MKSCGLLNFFWGNVEDFLKPLDELERTCNCTYTPMTTAHLKIAKLNGSGGSIETPGRYG